MEVPFAYFDELIQMLNSVTHDFFENYHTKFNRKLKKVDLVEKKRIIKLFTDCFDQFKLRMPGIRVRWFNLLSKMTDYFSQIEIEKNIEPILNEIKRAMHYDTKKEIRKIMNKYLSKILMSR